LPEGGIPEWLLVRVEPLVVEDVEPDGVRG
jgi:hypothetical protein